MRWARARLLPCAAAAWLIAFALQAQPPDDADGESEQTTPEPTPRISVSPTADDAAIRDRLLGILETTGTFENARVRVDEGVVFLNGTAANEQLREWAGRLARNTQDVVAVVNEIAVPEPAVWDLSPAWRELQRLGTEAVRRLPIVLIALVLLVVTWLVARWSVRGAASLFQRRLKSRLLRDVAARTVAVPVFLIGLYIVLSISGLTGLAVTVIGGTGLLGLVIGFAFRDIAENFLASVLLSMQRPFATDDLIEVAGYLGFVQSVNTRSTLLMTLEGNHVQIPNATIYKGTIVNFTANPLARHDFVVGIGYEDSIVRAQALAMQVLREHPAVSNDPEPLVLVETLGAATVNLRVYFWFDVTRYSPLKVRSAIIRLTKRAFMAGGISMPDEAREVVFPKPVPVQMVPALDSAADEERPPVVPSAETGPAEAPPSAGHASEAPPSEALPSAAPPSEAPPSEAPKPKRHRRKAPPARDRARATISAEAAQRAAATIDPAEESTQSEGALTSEAAEIERQAKRSRVPEGTTNLLEQ